VITGTGLLYEFLKIGTFFCKKRKTGTIFWENEKQVRFSEIVYDFLEKVQFSGKGTIFWRSPKRQGRKYGFMYAPPLEMIE